MATNSTEKERERGRSLHHRAALGETLTETERETLAAFCQVMERETVERVIQYRLDKR